MALADHYRILGLRTGASFADVKLAYRNLARLYHPDVNPGDQTAKDKFIQVTQAYQALLAQLSPSVKARRSRVTPSPKRSEGSTSRPSSATVSDPEAKEPSVTSSPPRKPELDCEVNPSPDGTATEHSLKQASFLQLRSLFQERRFPRAVALVEGLVNRFPNDLEVRQWLAITYYRWGHELMEAHNFNKARACFKKALRVDPQNKSLQAALALAFQQLDTLSPQQPSPASPPPHVMANSA
jgi:curved DNA-binding protein CbpA